MLLQEVFTAKTLDEIRLMAVKKFGVSENSINFEVLEEPKKSIFGRVKGEFIVKASYNQPVETESVDEKSIEPVQEVLEESSVVPEEVVSEPLRVQAPEKVETNVAEGTPVTETDTTESISNDETDETNVEVSTFPTPEELLEKAKFAESYVHNILAKMDIHVESEIVQNENSVVINFNGKDSSAIIGKRGETLDALQYLTAMICNKGETSYYRITLDACGYRAKRKVILENLARKVSKNVLKNGRSQTLEPMNPYERRIIHATISEIDGVTSRSVGEEPFRKVIVSSEKPTHRKYNNRNYKNNRHYGNGNSHGRGGHNNGKYRGNNNGRKKNYQPRSLDLKTSFEKDYHKPKPEDDINAGLYGKIEF